MTGRRGGTQLVLLGLGGQGIVFLSRVVAEAALLDGDDVLTAETHGMSQRGGAVEAHVKRGGFASSLVRPGSADAVLVLAPSRLPAALPWLAPDGLGFANAAEAPPPLRAVDAAEAARDAGFPRSLNLLLLGFAAASAPALFPGRDALEAALGRLSPEPVREANRRAFARGLNLA